MPSFVKLAFYQHKQIIFGVIFVLVVCRNSAEENGLVVGKLEDK